MSTENKIIITGLSKGGYEEYGKGLIKSFLKHRIDFPLVIYTHELEPLNIPTIIQREQMEIPDLLDFIESCDAESKAAGKLPQRLSAEEEKIVSEKEKRMGYSYRFAARKWCRMVFTMWDGAIRLEKGLMTWIDGDCVFRRSLPNDFFERFLPPDAAYAYLGRQAAPYYTETGFIIFRLPDALPILDKWKNFYTSGEVYSYPEWHSAYMFDRARELFPSIKGHNLTPGIHTGNTIHNCEVGKYIDHLMGSRRKSFGRSIETYPMFLRFIIRHYRSAIQKARGKAALLLSWIQLHDRKR